MKKATLDQIEPKNCFECVLSFKRDDSWLCGGVRVRKEVDLTTTLSDRPIFCPLKIVDE